MEDSPGVGGGDRRRAVAACQKMFADFSRQTAKGTPLYSQLAAGVAANPDVAGLLLVAPVQQRLPVLLFACVHSLVLDEPDSELARFYPNLAGRSVATTGDPVVAFERYCAAHHGELVQLLASRHTQTNEIGRTSLLLPCLTSIEAETGPLAHVDVGASAGLNLLIPHYDFVYEPGGSIETGSAVRLTCGTRGAVPVPAARPTIAAAAGIDRSPIDVTDALQARWLEACVWPDQVERFERLRAAIEIAADVGVEVRQGDAVGDVAAVVADVGRSGHPVVTTTWVMNYLSPDERSRFVGELDRIGAASDLSFVYAESPALCPELPGVPPSTSADQPTAVVVVRWRGGRRNADHVADAHPHGAWMHWVAGTPGELPAGSMR